MNSKENVEIGKAVTQKVVEDLKKRGMKVRATVTREGYIILEKEG